MKTLLNLPKSLIQYPALRYSPIQVVADATKFTFPDNGSVDQTIAIRLEQETSFDDVSIEVSVTATLSFTNPMVGIFLRSAADLNVGEQIGFVVDYAGIYFYHANTLIDTLSEFDLYAIDGVPTTLTLRRVDDYYHFTIGGITVSKQIVRDGGLYYRQNVKAYIYGNDAALVVNSVKFYTNVDGMDVALIGDSIFQGLLSGTGGVADTIKGILSLEYGMDIHEFCGSASIIKDQLDAFNELAILKPRFGVVGFGHNDEYFTTGRTIKDYNKLIAMMLQYNIQPVVCTLPYSPWVIVEDVINPYIRKTLFPKFPHVDLSAVLTSPGDYNSGPHPNPAGNRKLALAIKPVLDSLLVV